MEFGEDRHPESQHGFFWKDESLLKISRRRHQEQDTHKQHTVTCEATAPLVQLYHYQSLSYLTLTAYSCTGNRLTVDHYIISIPAKCVLLVGCLNEKHDMLMVWSLNLLANVYSSYTQPIVSNVV